MKPKTVPKFAICDRCDKLRANLIVDISQFGAWEICLPCKKELVQEIIDDLAWKEKQAKALAKQAYRRDTWDNWVSPVLLALALATLFYVVV